MIPILTLLIQIAGIGLLVLCLAHVPIGKMLKWRVDCGKLDPVNEQVFHVHTFFICLTILLMALPCIIAPQIFVEKSLPGAWISGSFTLFWAARLYFQFFVYRSDLWRGKRLETFVHVLFALTWLALAGLFGVCLAIQLELFG